MLFNELNLDAMMQCNTKAEILFGFLGFQLWAVTDTSGPLAMRRVADWMRTFSLGDSKREVGVDEAMAKAATPLVVVSSSLSSPDVYSSLVTNTIFECGLLLEMGFLK